MAETLLSIILVASSSKGTNLVFHWPPFPSQFPRLARPKPQPGLNVDNMWLAATNRSSESLVTEELDVDEWEYEWKRPTTHGVRDRSRSFAKSVGRSRPASRRGSPSKDAEVPGQATPPEEAEYSKLLGYSVEFLASILSPNDNLCHQKFDLVVDDLAFIGHPVCANADGTWKFRQEFFPERSRRGRGSRHSSNPQNAAAEELHTTDDASSPALPPSGLQTFHLVLVLDLPDPSSSASGNLFKYFHTIYEQIAFTVTAMLYQEQVHHRFVDTECETLGALRESGIKHSLSFDEFMGQALSSSSLARAIKALYDSIKANTIARIVINEVGVEVQLPPQLDHLLHPEDENPDYVEHTGPEEVSWGPELHFGWSLPGLAPWKSLLLYDLEEEHNELKRNLNQPGMSPKDQVLAEGLLQFLETVSIFDSLATVAHSLDWDLETQVYPTVRWLVFHRRAKIVDTVHRGLRTVFALPSKMNRSLPELAAEFSKAFPQSNVPKLPKLFAAISNPSSNSTTTTPGASSPPYNGNGLNLQGGSATQLEASHFFAAVVKSKDLIPLYQEVVEWLLRHDALVTMHLRIRLVATASVKRYVKDAREQAALRRFTRRPSATAESGGEAVVGRRTQTTRSERTTTFSRRASSVATSAVATYQDPFADDDDGKESDALSISEIAALRRQRRYSSKSTRSDFASVTIPEEKEEDEMSDGQDSDDDHDGDGEESDSGKGSSWGGPEEDNEVPSIISDPGMASPLQRKWIKAMSEGKSDEIRRRFELINQFFDGKRTDDEILFKADISRKQLREVLHHYEEHLLTFLHPA